MHFEYRPELLINWYYAQSTKSTKGARK
jgi:hypothetical protein